MSAIAVNSTVYRIDLGIIINSLLLSSRPFDAGKGGHLTTWPLELHIQLLC